MIFFFFLPSFVSSQMLFNFWCRSECLTYIIYLLSKYFVFIFLLGAEKIFFFYYRSLKSQLMTSAPSAPGKQILSLTKFICLSTFQSSSLPSNLSYLIRSRKVVDFQFKIFLIITMEMTTSKLFMLDLKPEVTIMLYNTSLSFVYQMCFFHLKKINCNTSKQYFYIYFILLKNEKLIVCSFP